ncbi:lysophospholipid acyltransferase family protein [Gracilimonas sp.]|uniref:lysophospholipid acyltransferase family protein n=1 Tax=Gracilimonas sp. TaxID=1974203 RepID=UPI002872A9FE|nr:lysophospholipid acyltransferase family protein [Gracilimonas sp.]
MQYLRAFIKLGIFLLVTILLYSMIMFCLAGSIFGLNYEKYRGYLLKTWGRWSCYVLGIKIEVDGPVPDPPFMLVSNHLSYADVFVLFSQLRGLFVAKSDVKAWPLIGFIVKTCGILFIDRNRKRDVKRVNELISKNINQNQGVIIFPEGTTSPGISILNFRTSLLEYPASVNLPVSYVAISYQTDSPVAPAYQSVCWWGDDSFFGHFLKLLKLKSISCTLNYGEQKIVDDDRKELAIELNKAVQHVFEPVISVDDFEEKHGTFKPLTF